MGPITKVAQWMDAQKYRQDGETFHEKCSRIAGGLRDSTQHFNTFQDILLGQYFLPGGRVQAAIGAARQTTAFNCFVSQVINDSMCGEGSIMDAVGKAAETMRRGGGIGFDFSKIRPRNDRIKSLDSVSSGPVSFMGVFDSVCKTISSVGHRRGAMMAVLRIDHPDIKEFITAKHDLTNLTAFNVSVAVTDEFMSCLKSGKPFPLQFGGRVYDEVNAAGLWGMMMRSTYEYAEPGVLFIDTINHYNNLRYCEQIHATNPCAEQPLPPSGACLLGSFNLMKYTTPKGFNILRFMEHIYPVVRAMDNVISRTIYPLEAQEEEAFMKRRIGLGVTGLANAGEVLGFPYGSEEFLKFETKVLSTLRNHAYNASIELAAEKGAFPLYSRHYLDSPFVQTLPQCIREGILKHGVRNSHLLSIAPTGTISLTADNVSSGIEPPYSLVTKRRIEMRDGPVDEVIKDHAYAAYGVKGKTSEDVTIDEHLNVLSVAQQFVDSSVSKTCNVGSDVGYAGFKSIYLRAWEMGCKGLTTFRAAGKRFGIMESCSIDPETGNKTCDI